MKFWELVSTFREEPNLLLEIFSSDKWRVPYLEIYSNMEDLIKKPRPNLLDNEIPLELVREIATRYTKDIFVFYPSKQQIRKATESFGNIAQEEYVNMTALEVVDRFGGSLLEEILEYGSAYIQQGQ